MRKRGAQEATLQMGCMGGEDPSASAGRSSEQPIEESHADVEPISGLPEVSCPRIGVDLRRDLIDARQRVHQDGVLAHLRKRLVVNAVDALDGVVRLMVREALLLDSGL